METEIKITEEKAYDYARPAAKTLYRQGFIKETWLVEMLAQAFLAGAACASTAHWERVDDKSNVPQGPQLLCAKKNRYGWFMHLCRYDGEDFFNEHCDSYHPTHYMVVPPIIQTENE